MPNLDSTGKFGRSMDCSQLLEFKKKYKTVQQQNGKTPPGDQKQKPAFNSDRLGGGGSDNGASWYYNQKGNSLIYDRFFGNRRFTGSPIDPRFREFVAWSIQNSDVEVSISSFQVNELTSNTITFTGRQTINGQTLTETLTFNLIVFEPNMSINGQLVNQRVYVNNTGGTITVTTADGFTRHYSNGQFFLSDTKQLDMP
jgi:hypothetical protein